MEKRNSKKVCEATSLNWGVLVDYFENNTSPQMTAQSLRNLIGFCAELAIRNGDNLLIYELDKVGYDIGCVSYFANMLEDMVLDTSKSDWAITPNKNLINTQPIELINE